MYLSPEMYLKISVSDYPSLYLYPEENLTKLKVFDSLFNTIGTGDSEAITKEQYQLTDEEVENKIKRFEKIKNGEQLFNGYRFDTRTQSKSMIPTVFSIFEEEKENYQGIMEWEEAEKNEDKEFVPYPNNSKEFSVIWKNSWFYDKKDWLEASLFFYQNYLNYYLNDDNLIDLIVSTSYNSSTPNSLRRSIIRTWASPIKRYSNQNVENLLKDYGLEGQTLNIENMSDPSDDEIYNFAIMVAKQKQKNYISFAEETIEMIKDKLSKLD